MSGTASWGSDPGVRLWPTPVNGGAHPRRRFRGAADTQRALLPPPLYTGALVEAAATTRPCWAVGGDFYDYFDTDREFRVVLGDACGKGAAAALQAAVVQGILAVQAEEDGGPARVMAHLNQALCRRLIPARFVALFYGILTRDHRLIYCNAGHCEPLLVNRHNVYRLAAGGPPLGMLSEARFEEAAIDLHTGDVLTACSDGVVEAIRETGNGGEEFGDARVLDVVQRNREQSAKEIVKSLLTAVHDFTAGAHPRDDLTAVVVRYLA